MAPVRTVCVYCGSGFGGDPVFTAAAETLGRALAEAGLGLVYGGGNVGLMGTVARAVLAHGGHVTGIIPDFLKSRERMLDEIQETIVVEDMHTRKRLMFERSDAFVALPGGIGTLEELVEQLTWAQLGQGFIREGLDLSYLVASEAEDVVGLLRDAAGATEPAPAAEALVAERF